MLFRSLRRAGLSYNLLTALKRLALPPELLTARPQRLRFLIFNPPGKLVHQARRTLVAAGLELGSAFPTGGARCACCLCRPANPRPRNPIFRSVAGSLGVPFPPAQALPSGPACPTATRLKSGNLSLASIVVCTSLSLSSRLSRPYGRITV